MRRASRFLRGAVIVLMGGLLSACIAVGRPFPPDRVPEIQLGKTTSTEIKRTFGTPWRTGLEDGMRTWTYARYLYSLFGGVKTRDLVIRFDERGVVTSYTFNSTYPNDLAP
jgi:hypothetical protein